MAPTKPQTNGQVNGKTNGNTAQATPLAPAAVQDLVQGLQTLLEGRTAQAIAAAIEESKRLSKENEVLSLANSRNLESIANTQLEYRDMRSKHEKMAAALSQADKTNEELNATVARVRTVLEELRAEIQKARDETARLSTELGERDREVEELEKALEDKKDLQKQLERLARTDTFFRDLAMKPVPYTAGVDESLNALFKSASQLVERFLGQDLDDAFFNKGEWQDFTRDAETVSVPVLPSNTALAKKMRVAAGLGYLASVSTRELFQPVYVTRTGDEMSDLLDVVEEKQKTQAAEYLRRCLFRAGESRLEQNALSRIDAASKGMHDSFKRLVPEKIQPQLSQALEAWCRHACDTWKSIQGLNCRVIPDLDWNVQGSVAVWEPLFRKQRPESQQNGSNEANGTPGGSGPAPVQPLRESEVAAAIWPCFYAQTSTAGEGYTVVANGLALTSWEADLARREKIATPIHGEHRNARKIVRRAVSDKSRRKSQEFLDNFI
ncbi:uncharacterized protein E0L32_005017 [Thyridium curvatum]|uniref:Uncharacterized protein n=1 Tax=Thyridium curvatum TaxID=1093900 RepID=A0A507BDQ7_9PEZI|nr:uncharacterized protein E0L32_005017 [Thyridium curvatum]TPX14908.1 hypothetical protein E0L32_005017 [Thyridium curvatum]